VNPRNEIRFEKEAPKKKKKTVLISASWKKNPDIHHLRHSILFYLFTLRCGEFFHSNSTCGIHGHDESEPFEPRTSGYEQ
jgi:hypothetical protein